MPSNKIVRMTRLLEYTGTREDIEQCIRQNAVQGFRDFGRVQIRSAFLPFPEEVPDAHPDQMPLNLPNPNTGD